MPYNEDLARRLRAAFNMYPNDIIEALTEKKMFGGLSFLYKGKMTVGIVKSDLAVRVIHQKMEKILALDYARPMDFTKQPMKEFAYISAEGIKTEEQLFQWIELGLEHAKSKLQ